MAEPIRIFTWGIVFSDLHIVSRTICSGLQAEVPIAESEVVPCGSLKVPLTVGAVRIVGSWEARTVEYTSLTYVGTSTCSCEEFEIQNECRAICVWLFFYFTILIWIQKVIFQCISITIIFKRRKWVQPRTCIQTFYVGFEKLHLSEHHHKKWWQLNLAAAINENFK